MASSLEKYLILKAVAEVLFSWEERIGFQQGYESLYSEPTDMYLESFVSLPGVPGSSTACRPKANALDPRQLWPRCLLLQSRPLR